MVVYSIIEVIGLLIAAIAIYYLLTIEASKEHKLMLMTLLLSTAHNIGVLMELGSTTLEGAMNAVLLEYVAASFFSLSFCYFVLVHCNRQINRVFIWVCVFLGFVSSVLVWTDRYTHFFYRSVDFTTDVRPHLVLEYNWGFFSYILSVLVPLSCCVSVLMKQIVIEKEIHQRKTMLYTLGLSFLPLLAMILHVTNPNSGFDFAPLTALIVVCIAIYMFVRLKFFDVVRTGQLKTLESIKDAIITIDVGLHVLYYNDSAGELFPQLVTIKEDDTITLASGLAFECFTHVGNNSFIYNDRHYESHVGEIRDYFNELRGYSVVIIDVTGIRAYAEKLAKKESPKDAEFIIEESQGRKVYDFVKDIKNASNSLMEIINGILDSSKSEAGRTDIYELPYETNKLTDELCTIVEYMVEEHNLEFKYGINESMPAKLLGDYEKIKQIAVKILSNAVKFTKEGYVKLEVDYETIGEKDIDLIIRISDTGIGISEEKQRMLLESIGNIDISKGETEKGKGYGLAICKDLAELMDGFIDMESKSGEGSTFTIIIPQKIVDKTPAGALVRGKESKMTGKTEIIHEERVMFPNTEILVVDDNKINLKVAVGLLQTYKANVDEASSGMDAIAKVKNKRYDMIFMDHMMPEMDGIEATALIRTECGDNGKKPIIIALTANALDGADKMFLGNGFDDFIAKPINTDELYGLMKKYAKPGEISGKSEGEDAINDDENIDSYRMNNVDIEEALKVHKTGIKNVLDLMVLFYEDGLNKVDLIRKYADEGELQGYEIEVHGLKSAAANIGAVALSNEAKEHEYAAKDGNEEFVMDNYEKLAADYREVLDELQKMFVRNGLIGNVEKEEENLPEIGDKHVLKDKLVDILEDLEDFKSKEAMVEINDLLQYRIGGERRAAVNNIKSKLKLYDDDAAEDLLRDLIKTL